MQVLMQRSDRRVEGREGRLEKIWQRIRVRYPLLKETAIIAGDGYLGQGGFCRPVLRKVMESLDRSRMKEKPLFPAEASDRLRSVLLSADQQCMDLDETNVRLVQLAVAPRKMYLYWHIPATMRIGMRQRYQRTDPDALLCLRVQEVLPAGGQVNTFDVELAWDETHRYLDLWGSDRKYLVDMGVRTGDGRFLTLARSNEMGTPRDLPAENTEETWRMWSTPVGGILRPQVAPFVFSSHPVILSPDSPDWPFRDLKAEAAVRDAYKKFFAIGPQILRVAPKPDFRAVPLLQQEYDARQQMRMRQEAARANLHADTQGSSPDLFMARLDSRQKIGNLSQRPVVQHAPVPWKEDWQARVSATPQTIKVLEMARRSRRLRAFARHQPVVGTPKEAASDTPVMTQKLDAVISRLSQAGVDLEVEVILRGRVKPGKRVRIGDTIIRPNPDGRFKVSCVFHDGRIYVPVEVVEAEVVVCRELIDAKLELPLSIC